jgi:hypothetical protein
MEAFEEVVRKGDAAAVRALLSARPDLRHGIDRPIFDTAPAIVFSRHDRSMVDALLEFGADINVRSQFSTTTRRRCAPTSSHEEPSRQSATSWAP